MAFFGQNKLEPIPPTKQTNDCIMRELLFVGGPHSKSQSSSVQAGTSQAGGKVQDGVEAVPTLECQHCLILSHF